MPEKALKLLVKTHDSEYIKFRFIIVGSDMKLEAQHTECSTVFFSLSLLFILFRFLFWMR